MLKEDDVAGRPLEELLGTVLAWLLEATLASLLEELNAAVECALDELDGIVL